MPPEAANRFRDWRSPPAWKPSNIAAAPCQPPVADRWRSGDGGVNSSELRAGPTELADGHPLPQRQRRDHRAIETEQLHHGMENHRSDRDGIAPALVDAECRQVDGLELSEDMDEARQDVAGQLAAEEAPGPQVDV